MAVGGERAVATQGQVHVADQWAAKLNPLASSRLCVKQENKQANTTGS